MVSSSSSSPVSSARRLPQPSPRARRQAQQLALQAALAARDSQLVDQLLGHWAHRHGVSSVGELWNELARLEPEGCRWWHGRDEQPVLPEQPVAFEQPLQREQPAPQPVQPRRLEPRLPAVGRPAPAPSHPALVSLRAWLPDQETPRAA